MKRYLVAVYAYRYANAAGGAVEIDVEAESSEEAEEQAFAQLAERGALPEAPHGLCHHCAGHYDLGDEEIGVISFPVTSPGGVEEADRG